MFPFARGSRGAAGAPRLEFSSRRGSKLESPALLAQRLPHREERILEDVNVGWTEI